MHHGERHDLAELFKRKSSPDPSGAVAFGDSRVLVGYSLPQQGQSGPVERIQRGGASARGHHQFRCLPSDFLSFPPGSVDVSGVQPKAPQSSPRHQAQRHRAGQEVQCRRCQLPIGLEAKSKGDPDVAAVLARDLNSWGPVGDVEGLPRTHPWKRQKGGNKGGTGPVCWPVADAAKPLQPYGGGRATHLEDALASLELGPEEGARLEGPYVPHTVMGPK
jgi:hypothetical protein